MYQVSCSACLQLSQSELYIVGLQTLKAFVEKASEIHHTVNKHSTPNCQLSIDATYLIRKKRSIKILASHVSNPVLKNSYNSGNGYNTANL